jgi:hypothetical protein
MPEPACSGKLPDQAGNEDGTWGCLAVGGCRPIRPRAAVSAPLLVLPPTFCRKALDHSFHPVDPSGSVGSHRDRRGSQPEQTRSVRSRPDPTPSIRLVIGRSRVRTLLRAPVLGHPARMPCGCGPTSREVDRGRHDVCRRAAMPAFHLGGWHWPVTLATRCSWSEPDAVPACSRSKIAPAQAG